MQFTFESINGDKVFITQEQIDNASKGVYQLTTQKQFFLLISENREKFIIDKDKGCIYQLKGWIYINCYIWEKVSDKYECILRF